MENTSASYSSVCVWGTSFAPLDCHDQQVDPSLLDPYATTSTQYNSSCDLSYADAPTCLSTSHAMPVPTPLPVEHLHYSPHVSEPMASHALPSSSHLSLDIHQPYISITEPTPIKRTTSSSLLYVDQFIAHHAAELEQGRDAPLPPQSAVPDWASWTPNYGLSPTLSNDMMQLEISSAYSLSPETQLYDLFPELNAASQPQLLASVPASTVAMPASMPLPQQQPQLLMPSTKRTNRGRPRRVSEPPKASTSEIRVLLPTRSMRRSSSERRGESSYPCLHPGCGKSFTRPYNLTSHMRTHTSEKPFPCEECGRRFARQHDRNRHAKLHWGIKPHACPHCQKPFARMDALNRHLRVENGCHSASPPSSTSATPTPSSSAMSSSL